MLEDMEPGGIRNRLTAIALAIPLTLLVFICAGKPRGALTEPQESDSPVSAVNLGFSITSNFPSYRAPTPRDFTGGWSTEKSTGFSYLCRGDFNGDAREDAAVILIGEDEWRLVVFERKKTGEYRPAFVGRPKSREELGKYWEPEILPTPQQVLLRTVHKGETWVPEAGEDPRLGRLKVDAIEIVTKPKPNDSFASLLMWSNGKYRQISGDPLVEVQIPATAK